jgi:hypothetical protein
LPRLGNCYRQVVLTNIIRTPLNNSTAIPVASDREQRNTIGGNDRAEGKAAKSGRRATLSRRLDNRIAKKERVHPAKLLSADDAANRLNPGLAAGVMAEPLPFLASIPQYGKDFRIESTCLRPPGSANGMLRATNLPGSVGSKAKAP